MEMLWYNDVEVVLCIRGLLTRLSEKIELQLVGTRHSMFFMGTLMVVLANQSLMVKYISAIRNVSSSLELNQV